jgi:hypothetical protein
MTRRSLIGALVGLAFAAAAGVGLAQVTTSSTPSTVAASTTESQATTTGDFEGKSADDQESEDTDFDSESGENGHQTSTVLNTTSTAPVVTSTSGDNTEGDTGTGQQKEDVCHKTGSGKEHTINIAAPAVPAHVAHGDTLGACVSTTTAASPQSTTTTTSSSGHGQTTHEPKKPKTQHGSNHSSSHGNSSHGNSGHSNSGKGHGK